MGTITYLEKYIRVCLGLIKLLKGRGKMRGIKKRGLIAYIVMIMMIFNMMPAMVYAGTEGNQGIYVEIQAIISGKQPQQYTLVKVVDNKVGIANPVTEGSNSSVNEIQIANNVNYVEIQSKDSNVTYTNIRFSTRSDRTQPIVVKLRGVKINNTRSYEQNNATSVIDITNGNGSIKAFVILENDNIITNTQGAAIELRQDKSLTVVSDIADEDASLRVEGGSDAAGIGGGNKNNAGNLSIIGGQIIAKGGSNGGAGIGSSRDRNINTITLVDTKIIEAIGGTAGGSGIGMGYNGKGGKITITDTEIFKALGSGQGSGIGGGLDGYADILIQEGTLIHEAIGGSSGGAGIGGCEGNITISAGTIQKAIGGAGGAGIGGSSARGVKSITISGGFIGEAKGGNGGAGIGTGTNGTTTPIYISGGTINNAVGGSNAAGIGGGNERGANITITGGLIKNAQSGSNAAGIGGGPKGAPISIEITGGIMFARGDGTSNTNDVGGGLERIGNATVRIRGGYVFVTNLNKVKAIQQGTTNIECELTFYNEVVKTETLVKNKNMKFRMNDDDSQQIEVNSNSDAKVYAWLPPVSAQTGYWFEALFGQELRDTKKLSKLGVVTGNPFRANLIFNPSQLEVIKPIELNAVPNNQENFIQLEWNAPSASAVYNYTVFRKLQNTDEFQSISSINIDAYKEAGKKIKVLNLYPTSGVGTTSGVYKSASLKMWMENNGYGKDVLSIYPVKISDFNNNPNILDEYDVIYVGHWDSNAGEGFTSNALENIKQFIESGRGFLVGHDTTAADILDKNSKFSLGSTLDFRQLFNIKTGYSIDNASVQTLINQKKIDFPKQFAVGGKKVEIAKTGALMNYPWVIRNTLDIPYAHTAAQVAYGDVWFTFQEAEAFNGRSNYPTIAELNGGEKNFYLTTWNNTAIIQTGHSNGEATADEQKILANVLFYLAQKTTDTNLADKAGQDVTPPTQSQITAVQMSANRNISISFNTAVDQGTTYIYKVRATEVNDLNEPIESQAATATVTVGLKGYIAVASNKGNLTASEIKAMKANEQGVVSVDVGGGRTSLEIEDATINVNAPVYVYLSSVDQANNVSEPYKYNYNPQALVLNSTQHEENTGAKWVELNWTKPEWLGGYKLYRDDEYISGSSGSTYNDKNDKINPNAPEDIGVTYNNGKISTEFLPAEDVEGSYTYKVSASNKGEFYEATASGAVMSGIKGYKISVDNNPNTVPTGEVLENLTKTGDKLQWVSGNLGSGFNTGNAYVHIIAVDNSGNTSQPVHMKVSVGYPEVALTVMNPISNKQVLAPYIVETTGPNYKEKILAPAVIVGKEEEIALKIKINKLENQKYQFIKVSEEEVKPNFPAADDNKWIDINRFKYSYQVGEGPWSTMKETTTGNTDGEQYDRIEVNAGLGMPDEAGKYYVAVKVQQAGGNPPREVLYGPFKVEGSILPNVYTKPPKSFTQPEGYSNIEYDASFDTDFKEVKITLDMSKLVDAHIVENTPIVFYKIGEAILTIKKGKKGGPAYATQVIRVGGQTSGDYEVSTDDNEIVIKLTNEVKAEDEYIISVLIPTKFGEVKYGPEGAARTYLTFIKQINEGEIAQAIVEAIVEGYPKLLEAEADEPAVFRSEPVTASESKVVTYLPLPKIN